MITDSNTEEESHRYVFSSCNIWGRQDPWMLTVKDDGDRCDSVYDVIVWDLVQLVRCS